MTSVLQAASGLHNVSVYQGHAPSRCRIRAALCLLINEFVSDPRKHGGKNIRLAFRSDTGRPVLGQAQTRPDSFGSFSNKASYLPYPVSHPQDSDDAPQESPASASPRMARLEVTDDGPGFPPETRRPYRRSYRP